MRTKAIFTVFRRKLSSGRGVYYYQCYNEKGRRLWARSTGLTKKTEAVAYCMGLFRNDELIPRRKIPAFAEFATGWWDAETCRYVKWRQLHEPLSAGTISIYRDSLNNHLKDFFGKLGLDEITPEVIEDWLLAMTGKGLKPNSVNLSYKVLRIMLGQAVNLGYLKESPADRVKFLKPNETDRIILTVEEAKKLFPSDWKSVWDNPVVYMAHRLAACTGMRIGELRGLRCEYVFPDYLFITGQYGRNGYLPTTKTKHNRNIPITPVMRRELNGLIKTNGGGFVFSEDGGATPITTERINRGYEKALKVIGIDHDERLKRKLSFHSWRHFFNTILRLSDVADSKVQSVTGHRTMKMTEHYTHFDTRQFKEVRDVQTKLLAGGNETKREKNRAKTGNGKTAKKKTKPGATA